jgi:hypothetical protein
VVEAIITGLVVAGVSELADRFPRLGALLLTLPIVSIVAFIAVWNKEQDEHYLQLMDDDHAAAMSNLSDRQITPSGTGPYLSEMVFIAMNRNMPELVEAATEHALGKKNKEKQMFRTPTVMLLRFGRRHGRSRK